MAITYKTGKYNVDARDSYFDIAKQYPNPQDATEGQVPVKGANGAIGWGTIPPISQYQNLAQQAAASAEAAASSASQAESDAASALSMSQLSQSWAVGETGARPGEDTNNSKYWAGVAEAAAEGVLPPAAVTLYNVILQDRSTGQKYALQVDDGRLRLLGIRSDIEATTPQIIDIATGLPYNLAVDNGVILIEEASA